MIMPVTVSAAFTSDNAPGLNALSEGRTIEADGEIRPYSDHYFWPHFAIYAKLPAVAVPTGFTASGLPIGVQVIGRSGQDAWVMRVARQIMGMSGVCRDGQEALAPPGFQD